MPTLVIIAAIGFAVWKWGLPWITDMMDKGKARPSRRWVPLVVADLDGRLVEGPPSRVKHLAAEGGSFSAPRRMLISWPGRTETYYGM